MQLGPYEILSPLGAGGMGEVYRARDTRLDRDVAIKILPDSIRRDADRIARFEREAKVLASLNHPNIGAIYGFEDHRLERGAIHFLVLEYVEGETLAGRLKRGALSVDEALEVGKQIAEALEAAHEKGVIHRDLKPGNVMVRLDGTVKVLDFGLARAMRGDPGGGEAPSDSPTITADFTKPGVVLGTAPYMSPEQARGRPVDKRTDIWSFGCILYECLSGCKAFSGESSTDLIARILERDPDWRKLPSGMPSLTEWLLGRCLTKDRGQRLHDMADVRIGLEQSLSERGRETVDDLRTRRSSRPQRLLWVSSLIAAVALGVGGSYLTRRTPIEPKLTKDVVRFSLPLPEGTHLAGWASPVVAFSPDGRKVAYVAVTDGVQRLYIRHLDRNEAIRVPGDEPVEGPFFSPDSRWVGYADGGISAASASPGRLKKVSVDGTSRQTICEIEDYFGATWADDGTIYYSGDLLKLWRVSEDGGTPSLVFPESAPQLAWPQTLPGGEYALGLDASETEIVAVNLSTGTFEPVGLSANYARYVSSGHLVYATLEGTLEAVPFDVDTRHVRGTGVAVLSDVAVSGVAASAFDLSYTGSLVYASGYLRGSGREQFKIVRLGRDGKTLDVLAGPKTLGRGFSLSSAGTQLAVVTWDRSLWIHDLQRNTRLKLPTGDARQPHYPLWAPDGERIVFSTGMGGYNLYIQYADGRRVPELLLDRTGEQYAACWTPDGRQILFVENSMQHGLYLLPMDGGEPRNVIPPAGRYVRDGQISPDGHWLAYASDESGRFEVYLQTFPELSRKIPVSTDGGVEPIWSRDGSEIFFLDGSRSRMMAVSVQTEPELALGSPKMLFEVDYMRYLRLDSDGKGFLVMMREPNSGIQTQLHVVLNWFEELKRLAPTDTAQ
jgi:serine/threonine-protein kinase